MLNCIKTLGSALFLSSILHSVQPCVWWCDKDGTVTSVIICLITKFYNGCEGWVGSQSSQLNEWTSKSFRGLCSWSRVAPQNFCRYPGCGWESFRKPGQPRCVAQEVCAAERCVLGGTKISAALFFLCSVFAAIDKSQRWLPKRRKGGNEDTFLFPVCCGSRVELVLHSAPKAA